MMALALRKLVGLALTLTVIIVLSFLLVRLSPGSPFTSDRALAPQVRQALDARYGLSQPVHQQLGQYFVRLAHGDLGPSIRYPAYDVRTLIGMGLPHTLTLAALALVWGLCAGIALGLGITYAHMTGRTQSALGCEALVALLQSLPSFVLGPLLILALALGLGTLPPAGWGTMREAVLPALTLGTVLAASFARVVWGGMQEVLMAPYIKTAMAKGLSAWQVLLRHMLVPGLQPLCTYLGPAISGVMVGSVATERIFCVPGIGPYFVDAALNRDYFVVMGIVVLQSVLLLVCNLVFDLAAAWLDPRQRQRMGG